MSNWALPVFGRAEGTTSSVTVTAGGTANTKGSYATLFTTTFDWDGFVVSLRSNNDHRWRIDFAIGASDNIIVADLWGTSVITGASVGVAGQVLLPIRVPASTALKARAQSTGASQSIQVGVTGFAYSTPWMPSYSRATACVDFTNTDPTNTVTNSTAWTEMEDSAAANFSALSLAIGDGGDTTRTAGDNYIDIGVGGAGSEQLLIRGWSANASGSAMHSNYCTIPIPVDIPAGTRVAFRTPSANADTVAAAALGFVA